MTQQNTNNSIFVSPFPTITIETPTGNPEYGRLTAKLVHHAPNEGFVAFTTQRGTRTFLSLSREHSIFYAEYDGKRYPIYMKVGETITVFYVSILDLFTKISGGGGLWR